MFNVQARFLIIGFFVLTILSCSDDIRLQNIGNNLIKIGKKEIQKQELTYTDYGKYAVFYLKTNGLFVLKNKGNLIENYQDDKVYFSSTDGYPEKVISIKNDLLLISLGTSSMPHTAEIIDLISGRNILSTTLLIPNYNYDNVSGWNLIEYIGNDLNKIEQNNLDIEQYQKTFLRSNTTQPKQEILYYKTFLYDTDKQKLVQTNIIWTENSD